VDIDGLDVTPHVAGNIVVTAHANLPGGGQVTDQDTLVVTENTLPIIEITAPQRGEFRTANNQCYVQGRVYDEAGQIADFTINGNWAYFDSNGYFNNLVELENGVNSIILWARDQSGNETTATVSVMYAPAYLPNGQRLARAIGARINQSGLNVLAGVATSVANTALAAALNGMSWPYVLFEDHVDDPIFGWELLWAKGYINKPTFAPLNIQIYPQGSYLHLRVTSSYVQTTGSLDYRIVGIGGNMPFTVTANNVQIDADVNVWSSNGQIQVAVLNLSVPEPDIDISIDNIFGSLFNWLIDLIVDSFVTSVITDMIEQEIMAVVPDLLHDLLEGLSMNFGFDFYDWSYEIAADFDQFNCTDGLNVWLGFSMDYGDGSWQVAPNTPDLPGSLLTSYGEPTLGNVIPGTSTPYEFGVVLSDDSLNLALHVMHRSGLLSLDLDEETLEMFGVTGFNLTTGAMGFFFPGLWGHYGMSAPVIIKLRPKLPPVFNVNPTKDGVDTEIQLGEFQLQMTTNDEVWAQIALAIYLPTTISIDTDAQTIDLTFGEVEMYSDLFDTLTGISGNTALFETFLPDLVQALLPMLLNGVLDNFPIPSLEGFTLDVIGFTKTGPQNDWIGVFGDLVQGKADRDLLLAKYGALLPAAKPALKPARPMK
jgi:hypothetical protein